MADLTQQVAACFKDTPPKEEVHKYDPNEPRDARGRWTNSTDSIYDQIMAAPPSGTYMDRNSWLNTFQSAFNKMPLAALKRLQAKMAPDMYPAEPPSNRELVFRAYGKLQALIVDREREIYLRRRDRTPTFYHGTINTVLDHILSEGLKTKPPTRNFSNSFYEGERGKSVYMVKTSGQAQQWADKARAEFTYRAKDPTSMAAALFHEAKNVSITPAILKLRLPKEVIRNVKPDEYFNSDHDHFRIPQDIRPEWITAYATPVRGFGSDSSFKWHKASEHPKHPLHVTKDDATEQDFYVVVLIVSEIPQESTAPSAQNPDSPANQYQAILKFNPHHAPAGSPSGGQFISGDSSSIPGLPSDVKLGENFYQYHEAVGRDAFLFSAQPSKYTPDQFDVSVTPKHIPEGWQQDNKGTWYDPQYATLNEYGVAGAKARSIYDSPDGTESGYIFRGMSFDEYQSVLKSGYIKSRGDYNLGPEQQGLTYFSNDKGQASYYASGFAPWQWQPTPDKPAVMVKVKDPGNHQDVAGADNTREVGIRGSVPADQIEEVYFGIPFIVPKGEFEVRVDRWAGRVNTREGSSFGYHPSVRWEKRQPTQKYDPGEPRDWRGRWTTGGGVRDEQPRMQVRPKEGEQRTMQSVYGGPPLADLTGMQHPDTPEFKEWFGKSVVVDKDGNPLPVFHGSVVDNIEQFGNNNSPSNSDVSRMLGAHFAVDPRVANTFTQNEYKDNYRPGGTMYPVYLSIQKPRTIEQDQKYGIASDTHALEKDMANVVFAERPDMFKDWMLSVHSANRYDIPPEKQADLLDAYVEHVYTHLKAGQPVPEFQGLKGTDYTRSVYDGPGPTGFAQFVGNIGLNSFTDYSRAFNHKLVEEYKAILQRQGYDGLRYIDTAPMEVGGTVPLEDRRVGYNEYAAHEQVQFNPTVYVPFNPDQIKSVFNQHPHKGLGSILKRDLHSSARTLYIHRTLLNAEQFCAWFKEQGFDTTLPPDDVHVTIAFSRDKVDWAKMDKDVPKVRVTGGARKVEPLGDGGAIVMHFESKWLADRWQELRDKGCSWDYEGYHPHVTISYNLPEGLKLENVKPFPDPLLFGPEVFAEVKEDWKDDIVEKDDEHG